MKKREEGYDDQSIDVVEHVEKEQETKGVIGIVECFHGVACISMLFGLKRQLVRFPVVLYMLFIPDWIIHEVSK